MDNQIKTWLFDILNSITEIQGYFEGEIVSFKHYKNDTKTKRATERGLSIIGEAVNRINKSTSTVMLSNSREIVGTRNIIVHGYDIVSDELVWSIVDDHLPKLKKEVEKLLSLINEEE